MDKYQQYNPYNGLTTKSLSKQAYTRPKKTFTDTLQSTQAMREKLKNYVKVKDIDTVPIGTHVRYVTWKNGKQRFCLGGLLTEINIPYVKLSNGSFYWSAQKQHFNDNKEVIFKTVFFRVLSKEERLKRESLKQQSQIEKLRQMNAKLPQRN